MAMASADPSRRWLPTAAALVVVAVALETAVAALRAHYGGNDFVTAVWSPLKALLGGVDPYGGGRAVARVTGDAIAAPLYAPLALVVHLPFAVLDAHRAAQGSVALGLVLVWVSIVLLLRPSTPLGWVGVAGAALVVTHLMTTTENLLYGQYTPWVLAGVSVAAFAMRRGWVWVAAVGIAVAAVKPQTAIPLGICLLALGHWRLVVRALAVLVAGSLPFAVAAVVAAGGPGGLVDSLRANYRFYNHIPYNDLASTRNSRVDLFGVVSHLGGPRVQSGLVALVVLLVLGAVVAVVLRPAGRRLGPLALDDPLVLWLVAAMLVVPLYHQPYDLLVVVLPLLAMARTWPALDRAERLVLGGLAGALLVSEVAFRWSYQARLARLFHVSTAGVMTTYHVVPTLLLLACAATAAWRLASLD